MSSPLDSALDRHPSLRQLLEDMIDFLDHKHWGAFSATVKNGRVVHYEKAISVQVTTRQSEDREAITSNGEVKHG